MPCSDAIWLLTGKQTENLQCERKYAHMYSIILYLYTSPQPLFEYINVIIVNHYFSQWFPVQIPHTIVAILSWNHKKMTLWISLITFCLFLINSRSIYCNLKAHTSYTRLLAICVKRSLKIPNTSTFWKQNPCCWGGWVGPLVCSISLSSYNSI